MSDSIFLALSAYDKALAALNEADERMIADRDDASAALFEAASDRWGDAYDALRDTRATGLEGVLGKLRRFGPEPEADEIFSVFADLQAIAAAAGATEPTEIGFGPYEPR